jgi:glycogen synthase
LLGIRNTFSSIDINTPHEPQLIISHTPYAINRAKTLYFENRYYWDEMVQRDMAKNVSWDNSAKQYKDLYLELTAW